MTSEKYDTGFIITMFTLGVIIIGCTFFLQNFPYVLVVFTIVVGSSLIGTGIGALLSNHIIDD